MFTSLLLPWTRKCRRCVNVCVRVSAVVSLFCTRCRRAAVSVVITSSCKAGFLHVVFMLFLTSTDSQLPAVHDITPHQAVESKTGFRRKKKGLSLFWRVTTKTIWQNWFRIDPVQGASWIYQGLFTAPSRWLHFVRHTYALIAGKRVMLTRL